MTMAIATSRARSEAIPALLHVFGGNLLVALSAFVVLGVASKLMPLDEFASLTILMSAAMVGSSVLDLGLNTTTIKQFSETRDRAFLDSVVLLKGGVFALALLPLGIAIAGGLPLMWGAVAICAGAMNMWTGLRACEQGRQDFRSYARSNLLFSVARLAFGLPALLTGSWLVVGLAIWVAPVIAISLLRFSEIRAAKWSGPRRVFSRIAAYSWIVYASSLSFAVLPYIPLFFAKERLAVIDVATYGMVLIILGPIGIIVSSLRGYALPVIASGREGALLSFPRVAAVLIVFATVLVSASFVLDAVYGATMPELTEVFAVYAGLFGLTALIGISNLRIHRENRPQFELVSNVVRFVLTCGALYAFGHSLLAISLIAGTLLLAGEVAVAIALWSIKR